MAGKNASSTTTTTCFGALCCCCCAAVADLRARTRVRHLRYDDVSPWVLPSKYARVVKVYDGDTITLATFVGKRAYRFRCRLARIDAPEMRPTTKEGSERSRFAEKKAAIVARDALRELLLDRVVEIRDAGTEKYGRVLADIYLGKICASDWMLDQGLAVPYDGGSKGVVDWSTFPLERRKKGKGRKGK